MVENFEILTRIFEQPFQQLKVKDIRLAERALLVLESLWDAPFVAAVAQWERAARAFEVLSHKQDQALAGDQEKALISRDLDAINRQLDPWNQLSIHQQKEFLHHGQLAKVFEEQGLAQKEDAVLKRFRRYQDLIDLMPYADQVCHISEALEHYENHSKYALKIEELEHKIKDAEERLVTVGRGFKLSLLSCVFLVTVPLCVPFAISLWRRKKDIRKRLADLQELARQENRKLQLAEEGSLAYQEIFELLGPTPLPKLLGILEEVGALKNEFQLNEKTSSLAVHLVLFLHTQRFVLEKLFGPLPSDPGLTIVWFHQNMVHLEKLQKKYQQTSEQLEKMIQKQLQCLKGYSLEMIQQHLKVLEDILKHVFPFHEKDRHDLFNHEAMKLCLSLPSYLSTSRNFLSVLTNGYSLSLSAWQAHYCQLKSHCNLLNSLVSYSFCIEKDLASKRKIL